jgi:mRNA interferase MazF
MVNVKRFEVHLAALDPTLGSEIKKTRPVVIISPDTMNSSRLRTVIIAPLTTTIREYAPTRVTSEFHNKKCQIAFDQIRTIDRCRLIKKLGLIDKTIHDKSLKLLRTMFT